MKLTEEQIEQFDTEGFIFLPSCFSKEEVAILNDAATKIYASERKEVWRESSGIARTAFAAHTTTRPIVGLPPTQGWLIQSSKSLTVTFTCINIKLMRKRLLMETCGNGTKILECGIEMMGCRNPER